MSKESIEYLILIGITFGSVSIVSYILRRILSAVINRHSTKLKVDPTNFIFLKNSISFILYSAAIFFIFHKIPYFKTLGNALFASAGIIAAMIGFASQKAFSNIIGGLFILIFKPFGVGDIIEVSGNRKGTVEEITLRHTIIRDFEFRRLVIPNSVISDETIINSSIIDEKIRKQINIGIAYDADVDLASKIIRNEISNHRFCLDERTAADKQANVPKVEIRMVDLGDFAVTLRAYVWTANFDESWALQCDVLKSIKREFNKQGVEIPFPYRTIVFKDKQQKFNEPNENLPKPTAVG